MAVSLRPDLVGMQHFCFCCPRRKSKKLFKEISVKTKQFSQQYQEIFTLIQAGKIEVICKAHKKRRL